MARVPRRAGGRCRRHVKSVRFGFWREAAPPRTLLIASMAIARRPGRRIIMMMLLAGRRPHPVPAAPRSRCAGWNYGIPSCATQYRLFRRRMICRRAALGNRARHLSPCCTGRRSSATRPDRSPSDRRDDCERPPVRVQSTPDTGHDFCRSSHIHAARASVAADEGCRRAVVPVAVLRFSAAWGVYTRSQGILRGHFRDGAPNEGGIRCAAKPARC